MVKMSKDIRWEKEYEDLKKYIEFNLNDWEGISLLDMQMLMDIKLNYNRWRRYVEEESIYYEEESLEKALKLMWEMIRRRMIEWEIYKLVEYGWLKEVEVQRGIDKEWKPIMKKIKVRYRLDIEKEIRPCEIEDEEELDRLAKEFVEKMKKVLKRLKEKYGDEQLDLNVDMMYYIRSDCYEWEIRLDEIEEALED